MAKKRPNKSDVDSKPSPKRGKRVRIPAVPMPGSRAGETLVEDVGFCGCTNDQLERGTSCGLPQCPNMAYFPKPEKGIEHPIAEGAHVHHVAGIPSKGQPDSGGLYWGRIVQVVKPPGGAYEYDVMPDGGHRAVGAGGEYLQPRRPFLTIWEEHHIDEVLEDE